MVDVRPIDMSPSGIAETCQLLNVVYPHAKHLTVSYLDRLYNGNPLGPTFGFSGFEGGQLIGHYLMVPILTRIFGKEELGIWPFQLATHPGFRGKGLFSTFVERSFEACRERGYGHLLGVGNAQSTPLFVGKWGFQSIRRLDARLGVGPLPPSDGGHDCDLVRVWDRAGIAWRLTHASEPYRVKYRHGKGHIYAQTGKYGIWAEIGAWDRSLLPPGLPELHTVNPLRLWLGADESRDFSRSPYFVVPHKYRPSPLNLLFHDLTDQKRRFEPKRVRYEVFDFDAY